MYIDTIFAFYGCNLFFSPFFLTPLYYFVGCLSRVVWTHTVLGCRLCMCFVFLYLHLFSAIEHVSHGKAL